MIPNVLQILISGIFLIIFIISTTRTSKTKFYVVTFSVSFIFECTKPNRTSLIASAESPQLIFWLNWNSSSPNHKCSKKFPYQDYPVSTPLFLFAIPPIRSVFYFIDAFTGSQEYFPANSSRRGLGVTSGYVHLKKLGIS